MVNYLRESKVEYSVIASLDVKPVVAGRYFDGNWSEVAEKLSGASIQAITRRSKYIIFYTSKGILLCHNKFTGCWEVQSNPWTFDYLEYKRVPGNKKDVRMTITLSKHSGNDTLIFHDARALADMIFYENVFDPRQIKRLNHLGPEIILTPTTDDHFDHECEAHYFRDKMKATKKHIKLTLLDQVRVAGIGNIYACESLWQCLIHPETPANQLLDEQLDNLYHAVQTLMTIAIEKKVKYDDYIGVFRRKECRRCKGPVSRIVQANRGTYLCISCQPCI